MMSRIKVLAIHRVSRLVFWISNTGKEEIQIPIVLLMSGISGVKHDFIIDNTVLLFVGVAFSGDAALTSHVMAYWSSQVMSYWRERFQGIVRAVGEVD